MTEQELKAFVRVVTAYFLSVSGIAARPGIPYIKSERTQAYDYTGLIGISGSRRGGVYFTARKELLAGFGRFVLPGDLDDEGLYDLVGEMTNTIAGNMREIFGSSFLISVPIVILGRIEDIGMRLKPPVFVIPLQWDGLDCHLAVGLE